MKREAEPPSLAISYGSYRSPMVQHVFGWPHCKQVAVRQLQVIVTQCNHTGSRNAHAQVALSLQSGKNIENRSIYKYIIIIINISVPDVRLAPLAQLLIYSRIPSIYLYVRIWYRRLLHGFIQLAKRSTVS